MKPPIPNPLQTPNPETLKIHVTLNPKGLFACVAFWKYLPSGRWAAKMRLLNLILWGSFPITILSRLALRVRRTGRWPTTWRVGDLVSSK